jgi:hypothetical protein
MCRKILIILPRTRLKETYSVTIGPNATTVYQKILRKCILISKSRTNAASVLKLTQDLTVSATALAQSGTNTRPASSPGSTLAKRLLVKSVRLNTMSRLPSLRQLLDTTSPCYLGQFI